MEVNACDGRCCAVFPFHRTPTDMRESWSDFSDDISVDGRNGLDCLMIADMLIPLATDEAKDRCEQFGIDPKYVDLYEAEGMQGYTCKNWNEETRECGVYESRPDMCATYPYARECFHCGSDGGCANQSGWRRKAEGDVLET